ncbi:hypothetical protein JOF29_005870 [Kribbella aluminosa]|uniref:PKD domain-containing protein n=1 Tax=Kribbella aluminosa TaxID=416017 RepID=A0ABS4USY5_9ACTN|nr:hypothetical protein [Kribbella aluminosa]MBP2354760.1 hypothetical protein [Kribbella aluminosa]
MMNPAATAGLTLSIFVGVAFAGTVEASADMHSSVVQMPTRSDVDVTPTREGAQASQRGIIKRHGKHTPPAKKITPKTTQASGNRHPRGNQRRDNPPKSVKDDFELNIGICGRMQPDGTVPGPTRCQPGRERGRVIRPTVPPKVVPPRPEDITWEQVRSETKNIVFPGLTVKVQPKGRTLVNMATIVYTDDSKVSTTTVTLLGFPVVVEATPISYTWDFGDGSPTVTTSTPGKPYPSADITHKYRKRQGVGITVTTNYAARFNVADTGWQYVEGTVPITGPATLLQVREAIPVLVDPGR